MMVVDSVHKECKQPLVLKKRATPHLFSYPIFNKGMQPCTVLELVKRLKTTL